MFSKRTGAFSIIILLLALSGCSIFLADLDKLLPHPSPEVPTPEPTPPPPVNGNGAPVIESLDVDPRVVMSGGTTRLTFRLQVSDPNGDLGDDEIILRRTIRAIAGNLAFDETPRTLSVPLLMEGSLAIVVYLIDVDIPFDAEGIVQFEIAVADRAGHFSEPSFIEIQVR